MFGFKKKEQTGKSSGKVKAKAKKGAGGGLLGVIAEHGGGRGGGSGGGLMGLGSPMFSLIMEPIQIAGASAAIGDADSDFATMFKSMRSSRLQARIDALGGELARANASPPHPLHTPTRSHNSPTPTFTSLVYSSLFFSGILSSQLLFCRPYAVIIIKAFLLSELIGDLVISGFSLVILHKLHRLPFLGHYSIRHTFPGGVVRTASTRLSVRKLPTIQRNRTSASRLALWRHSRFIYECDVSN